MSEKPMTAVEVSEIIGLINEEIRRTNDGAVADGLSKAKRIIIDQTGWTPALYRGGYR